MQGRSKTDLSLRKVRSAITNGSSLIHDIDHRSAEMRRLRDLVSAHVSDLGGDDAVSHSERILINRASMLTLQLEMLERVFADNDFVATPREIDRYQRVCNTLRRTLEALGLQRRAKDVTSPPQTLDEIAAEIEAENAARAGAS